MDCAARPLWVSGLKKAQGAAAQCGAHGHRHGIRVEAAKGEGDQPIPALAGETLHDVDNDKSAALIQGEDRHNRKVELKGRLFPKEQVLEVREASRSDGRGAAPASWGPAPSTWSSRPGTRL